VPFACFRGEGRLGVRCLAHHRRGVSVEDRKGIHDPGRAPFGEDVPVPRGCLDDEDRFDVIIDCEAGGLSQDHAVPVDVGGGDRGNDIAFKSPVRLRSLGDKQQPVGLVPREDTPPEAFFAGGAWECGYKADLFFEYFGLGIGEHPRANGKSRII